MFSNIVIFFFCHILFAYHCTSLYLSFFLPPISVSLSLSLPPIPLSSSSYLALSLLLSSSSSLSLCPKDLWLYDWSMAFSVFVYNILLFCESYYGFPKHIMCHDDRGVLIVVNLFVKLLVETVGNRVQFRNLLGTINRFFQQKQKDCFLNLHI